jgi:hypothetical protein
MKRSTAVLSIAAAALAMGAVTQVAVYSQRPTTTTYQASWAFRPTSEADLKAHSSAIVLGEVVAVRPGPDIVTKQPNEPSGQDRIPTRRITLRVVKAYKGTAAVGGRITLFQTGGAALPNDKGKTTRSNVAQVVLEGDPVYKAGQQYLLMLTAGPDGTLRPVAPEGRFLNDAATGKLTPMVQDAVARGVASKSLKALEPTLLAGG